MEREKRRKKQNPIVECDTDDDDNIRSAQNDPDWNPKEDEIDHHPTLDNDTSLPEDTEFDSTEGFRLKVIKNSKQSSHVIWNMFGQLNKNDKPIDRVKSRIYCIRCFEKKKFKR